MKILRLFFMILAIPLLCACNQGQKAGQDKPSAEQLIGNNVKVYYFHFNHRCATCRAVESEARKNVRELYGDKVSFTAVNLDTQQGEKTGKKLNVYGQTLLIVSGDKKIDLTSEGFMYARTEPEKLKQVMKEKIDELM